VQELIRQVLYEQASQLSSRVIIDVLIASGNEALVKAILAKSLTPQQAELLKQVAKDPQVEEAMKEVKDRLLQGVNASVENVKEQVLPQVQSALADAATGTVAAIKDEIDNIPGVGAAMGVVDAVTTGLQTIENATDIKDEFNDAIQPAKDAMGKVGKLTSALDDAATRAQQAASDVETQASSTVAGVSDAASDAASNAASGLETQASSVVNPTQDENKKEGDENKKEGDENKKEENENQKKQGGGSRTRRRIHKLSRRIERTLRRIQKKYGLQDKNSFLRRTLKRQ